MKYNHTQRCLNMFASYRYKLLVLTIFSFTSSFQCGCLMDNTFGLSAGRSRVQIPGRSKYSLRTIAVDAKVNYPILYLLVAQFKIIYILRIISKTHQGKVMEETVQVLTSLFECPKYWNNDINSDMEEANDLFSDLKADISTLDKILL